MEAARPQDARLAATDLACRRGERLLFRGLSFELKAGEALQIVGPNGQRIPGAESCQIFGDYTVHPWALYYLFSGEPKDASSYQSQMWMWLALRGRELVH